MERILNFRTLAEGVHNKEGKKIRPNTILRSGELSHASEKDLNTLKKYGLKNIYDFRAENELIHSPQLIDKDFISHHYDILEQAGNFDTRRMSNVTQEMLINFMAKMYSDKFGTTTKYKGIFNSILNQEEDPFLFHCSAGKDRTGIFGIILMFVLDFELEDIKNEYLKVDEKSMAILLSKMTKQLGIQDEKAVELMAELMKNKVEYFDAYYSRAIKDHGDYDNYLESHLGVSKEMKDAFKTKYLI